MSAAIRPANTLFHRYLSVMMVCLCLLYCNNAFAQGIVPILKTVHVEHTSQSINSIPEAGQFKEHNKTLMYFDSDLSDAYWIKPTLPNGQNIEPGYLFAIQPVNTHSVELIIPALNGNNPIQRLGRFTVDTAPKFSHRSLVFEIPENYSSGQDVFFYVQARNDEALKIEYWQHDDYLVMDRKYSGYYSALFASLFILVLINLIFFIAIRDKNHIFYVIYLASFLLFIMMTTGKLYEFSAAKWLAGNYNSALFIFTLCCFTLTVFIQQFLNLKIHTPFFYKVTIFYMLAYSVIMLMALVLRPAPYIAFTIVDYFALLSMPFVIYVAIKSFQGGNKKAYFFLLAFTPLLVMVLVRILALLNYIPNWDFALAGFQIAILFQAIVLTIGLADHMLQLREERDKAQRLSDNATNTLHSQQEFSDFLARISTDIRAEPNGNHDTNIVSSFFKRINHLYNIERGALIYQVDNELKILSDNAVNQAGFEDYIHDHVAEVSRICHGDELKELPTFNHAFFSRFTKMLILPIHMRGHEWSGMLLNLELTRKFDTDQYDSLHHYATELVRILINAHKLKFYSIKAETDDLTQVMNRGAVLEQLDKEIANYHISQLPLSIAFLDIDHFKKINDTLGHEAGDTCLAYLALQIRRYLPDDCYVGRMGGDEFLFIFPNHLSNQVNGILNALSNSLETLIIDDVECSFTLSIGIAQYNSEISDVKAFLRLADETLYLSKENGRARITIAA